MSWDAIASLVEEVEGVCVGGFEVGTMHYIEIRLVLLKYLLV